jgi:hypothetical protein
VDIGWLPHHNSLLLAVPYVDNSITLLDWHHIQSSGQMDKR